MKLKNIILAVSFPALFVGILLYSRAENEDARQLEELRRNVEVLPEGVEEEWNLYLEGRLQFLLLSKGRSTAKHGYFFLGKSSGICLEEYAIFD